MTHSRQPVCTDQLLSSLAGSATFVVTTSSSDLLHGVLMSPLVSLTDPTPPHTHPTTLLHSHVDDRS